MLLKSLALVEAGEACFVQQDESLATHSRMFVKQDGAINWDCTAQYLYNQVRASLPWPVAYFRHNDQPMRIYSSSVVDEVSEAAPGTIVRIEENALIVATGKFSLAIHALQAPGKNAIPVADYQRGNPFEINTKLENG